MTGSEQERELGKMVLKLREKETEHRCLRSKAHDLIRTLKAVFKLYEQGQHDESLLIELDKLPSDNEITGVFRELVETKADIGRLKNGLGLSWDN